MNTDAFAEALAKQVEAFKIGPGYNEGVNQGPLIHDRALQKAKEHTDDAVQKGATVLTGDQPIPSLGPNFFKPAVIRDMTKDMKVAYEETFGPIAALFVFDTEAKVVQLANDTRSWIGRLLLLQRRPALLQNRRSARSRHGWCQHWSCFRSSDAVWRRERIWVWQRGQ